MWFAIFGEDNEGSLELRKELRPAHLQRLAQLQDQGRLLLAGPHPLNDTEDPMVSGFTGSLMVVEFASLEEKE